MTPGETSRAAAAREPAEETGVRGGPRPPAPDRRAGPARRPPRAVTRLQPGGSRDMAVVEPRLRPVLHAGR
ncbi:hypothetical protein ACH4F6_34410 [Streptomyces sp. NPDC017936]|uniref:hypothetical protein n=1 Tax=Streptomyces sp. NPDC017936 TaxID=3365016 RepID=UPI0037B4B734